MEKIWTIDNIETFGGKFYTNEELHELVDGTVLNTSNNPRNTVVKNDNGIFVFDTSIYTQAKDGVKHFDAGNMKFEKKAVPADIGVANELLATNVGIYNENSNGVHKDVVIGAMSTETNWNSMDSVLSDREQLIKYLNDVKIQITKLLDAGFTHEGIFRIMNGEPHFGIVQNGKEARILSMYDSWAIPMDSRSDKRRTQDTWACLVNLMNYCRGLQGSEPLYDPTKYINSGVVDGLIEDFRRTK